MNKDNSNPASRIAGIGKSVPDKILTNEDFERMVDTSDEWITARTGIKRRHVVEPGTPASLLATEASRIALQRAGVKAKELDLIILATVTGDMKFPSTAIFVQANLGADNAAAFDISAACSGFIYGLQLGDLYIRSGQAQKVLVIGIEILSSMTNYEDRSTCVLFGDGAGAAVLVPSNGKAGLLSSYIGSDGRLNHLLYSPGGGSLYPATNRELPYDIFTLKMCGNEVFKHAVHAMGDAALKAMELAHIGADELDLLVPHQANIRIINATAKRVKVPPEKVYINIQEYGNTSTASIPIALDEALEKGIIQPDNNVLCVAFGGGFTWASCVIRF